MEILIVEDNLVKREKIVRFMSDVFDISLTEAASYNSGLNAAINGNFDFLILDMSMPTFDRSETTQGGRFRDLGGKEIAAKQNKQKKLPPFIVLTGYKDFSTSTQNLSIEQIHDLLTGYGKCYKGCIIFDSSETQWQEKLKEVISEIIC